MLDLQLPLTILIVSVLCAGAYVYAYVLERRAPRIADITSLAATMLALLLVAVALLWGSADELALANCGLLLAIAGIAQAASALRKRPEHGGAAGPT